MPGQKASFDLRYSFMDLQKLFNFIKEEAGLVMKY